MAHPSQRRVSLPPALRVGGLRFGGDVPRLAETLHHLWLCWLAALASLPETAWLIPAPLRLLAVVWVIAFLPGYLLILGLFARLPPVSIYWMLCLSPAASFSLIILDALLFNLLSVPVSAALLIACQSAWALILLLITLLPSGRPSRRAFLSERLLNTWRVSSPFLRLATLLCALLALLFVGTLTRALFAPPQETFTELYLTDPTALNLSSPEPIGEMSITVVNHEQAPREYLLEVSTGSYAYKIPVVLQADEARIKRIAIPLGTSAAPELLRATLYLPGSNDPYRQVHAWLDKSTPSFSP